MTKVWMGRVTIGVKLTDEEADKMRKHLGDQVRVNFDYRERALQLSPRNPKESGYSAFNASRPSGHGAPRSQPNFELSWARTSIKAERWPTFGQTAVERVSYTPGLISLLLPSEENRNRLKVGRFRVIGKNGNNNLKSVQITAPLPDSPPAVTVMRDLLDTLRHYRDKLNQLRLRHPENITFKVRPDGTLGFEFLADE